MKPETVLRNAILDTLRRIGVFVHTNAQRGSTYHGGLGPGSPDLVACVRGRYVGLEVKTDTGRVSAEQRAWGDDLERAGGVYRVVRSVAEAIAAVRESSK